MSTERGKIPDVEMEDENESEASINKLMQDLKLLNQDDNMEVEKKSTSSPVNQYYADIQKDAVKNFSLQEKDWVDMDENEASQFVAQNKENIEANRLFQSSIKRLTAAKQAQLESDHNMIDITNQLPLKSVLKKNKGKPSQFLVAHLAE